MNKNLAGCREKVTISNQIAYAYSSAVVFGLSGKVFF